MIDWSEKAGALTMYLRPLSFPLAVSMVERAQDFPEKKTGGHSKTWGLKPTSA